MEEQTGMKDKKQFMEVMKNVYDIYIEHGARSNKNVNYFHNYIKSELEKIFTLPDYSVVLEYDVVSTNSSKKKRCDIVVLKMNTPYIIFPVKIIKTNYKQNKNNAWENLTGELHHLHWANENIIIIPINILMNKTPYLDKSGKISKFENITIEDIEIYKMLTAKHITFDMINYILIVEHVNTINEPFDKTPRILDIDSDTPYRTLFDIVKGLV
uniref:Uncharacterized protein n=1 Tax=viral metagenome TaxID=1070528 RepID=A0A6C0LMK7_9ZZZZ